MLREHFCICFCCLRAAWAPIVFDLVGFQSGKCVAHGACLVISRPSSSFSFRRHCPPSSFCLALVAVAYLEGGAVTCGTPWELNGLWSTFQQVSFNLHQKRFHQLLAPQTLQLWRLNLVCLTEKPGFTLSGANQVQAHEPSESILYTSFLKFVLVLF